MEIQVKRLRNIMNSKFNNVVTRLKNCIQSGNKEEWHELLMVEDDVAKQSMNKWFEDYFILYKAKRCQVILEDSNIKEDNCELRCLIDVEYWEEKKYSADLLLCVKEDFDAGAFKITRIECFHQPVERRKVNWQVTSKNDQPWWGNMSLRWQQSENEELQHVQLARAITRNVRFREAHIQLECASIMTSMMSSVLKNVCYQLELPSENSEQKLKYLYDILMDKFHLQIARPDRDNTWASKYLAPWYGLEEILWNQEEGKRIAVSCNFFMSTLYALLRLSGFKVHQLVQFRIVNQDYLLVKTDDKKLFFISHDNLTRVTESTIYPSGTVNKVFGAEWFIDFKRNEAAINDLIKEEYNFIAQNTFLPTYSSPVENDGIMDVPINLNTDDFRSTMLRNANSQKSSIYIWSMYANQSLYVTKPETYLYWSIQSNWGTLDFHNEKEIYQYMGQMGKESIFPENDRIMTADQCIRHQTGGTKDRAVFLMAALLKFLNARGFVILTKKYHYVVYRLASSNKCLIYNVSLEQKSKSLDGEIILAFDNSNSCSFIT